MINYKKLYQFQTHKLKLTKLKLLLLSQRNRVILNKLKEKTAIIHKLNGKIENTFKTTENPLKSLDKLPDNKTSLNCSNKEKKIFVGEDNINKYVTRNKCFTKVNIQNGFLLFCNKCTKQYPVEIKRKTFSNYVEYKGELAKNLENGKCKVWYTLKSTLEKHIKSHACKEIQINITRKLLALSLSLCKLKGAWSNYELLVGTTHCMNVNIGQICHGKNNMIEMIRTLRLVSLKKLRDYLLTPLKSTGLLPHFSLTFDKATINKTTNQAVMIIISVGGSRVAFPIDCSPIYNIDNEGRVEGGKISDLTKMIKDCLINKLGFTAENMNYLVAIYADGQYGDTFYKKLKGELGISSDSMILNIWDTAHWLDLAVKQSGRMEFFRRFIMKSNKFTNCFFQGKSREEFRGAAKVLGLKALELSTFTVTRFSSSCLKALKTLYNNYPALIKAYKDKQVAHKVDKETEYFLENNDFLMDICVVIDILTPISQLMEIVQSTNTTPWKICRYFPRLINILIAMENCFIELLNGKKIFPDPDLFPYLREKWNSRNQKEINDLKKDFILISDLNDSNSINHSEKSYQNKAVNKRKRIFQNEIENKSKQKEITEWSVRNTKECLKEYLEFCSTLKKSLNFRFNNSVGNKEILFSKCFDLNLMLDSVAEFSFYHGEQFYHSLKVYHETGLKEFLIIYNNLCKLPQFIKYLTPDKSANIYKCWKIFFQDLIYKYADFQGDWFVNERNIPYSFKCNIKSIMKIYKQEKLSNTYKIVLIDDNIYENVRFLEENLIRFIEINDNLLNNKIIPLALYVILDYVFSTCGTEACVEGFFSEMKNHKRSGGQNIENIVDASIIDFIFPEPRLCWEFLKYAAEQHIMGNGEMKIYAHREPIFKTKSHKPWKVSKVLDRRSKTEIKFPFLFTIDDSNSTNNSS